VLPQRWVAVQQSRRLGFPQHRSKERGTRCTETQRCYWDGDPGNNALILQKDEYRFYPAKRHPLTIPQYMISTNTTEHMNKKGMVTIEFARTNGSAEYNSFADSLRKFARSSRTKGRPSKQGLQLLRYVYPKRLLCGRARAYSLGYQRQTLTFRSV
jgi:hypothetical protein